MNIKTFDTNTSWYKLLDDAEDLQEKTELTLKESFDIVLRIEALNDQARFYNNMSIALGDLTGHDIQPIALIAKALLERNNL